MKQVLVTLALVLLAALPASAQTETPMPTPTATPDITVRWVLTPYLNPQGTPVVQEVVFEYTVSAGDVAIILLAAAAIFLLWAGLAVYLWESKKRGNHN